MFRTTTSTTNGFLLLPFLLVLLVFTGCRPAGSQNDPLASLLAVADSVTVRSHMQFLSHDLLEGRGTGTRGEALTVEYIAAMMQMAGLEPGGDSLYFQRVPLMGSTPRMRTPLSLTHTSGQQLEFQFVDEFIASTDLDANHVSTRGELVFVGYGISAPGYDWDDFKDVDVRDKILVMFVNDPPATPEEPELFQADTLTYFGRWTYKQEEASRRGAKGVLLIHTTPTAGYPFTVLSNSAQGEQIQLSEPPENPLEMKGWLTEDAARQLAQLAGTTLEDWFEEASSRSFTPQPLPITASLDVDYTVRRFHGTNVIGIVPGRTRPDEAILYTAHHDHLGIGPADARGDSIYNGAVDNASGVAMLLAAAKAFGSLDERPERSLVFVTVTAEESGLLGSAYYARHPAIPMDKTVANINVDSGNLYGESLDIVGLGAERSELSTHFREAARAENLAVTPDPRPNEGIFFRSDQLSFAREGVPALFINTGSRFAGQPEDYYSQMNADYRTNRYHQPADEFDPDWPMEGLLQQTRVALRLGYHLANSTLWPAWYPGEAFAEARAASRN